MRVRVGDPAVLRNLILYLRDCGCVAEQASATEADVFAPSTLNERAARMEVGAYLTAWRVRHDGVSAELVA